MYQIKYTNGYDLTSLRGNMGRVSDRNGNIVFEGSYTDAEKWLAARGVAVAETQNRAYPQRDDSTR